MNFSICSFSNIVALSTIDNDSIAEMEKFVRDDLLDALDDNSMENVLAVNDNDKKFFFGLYHAKPEKFRFLPGEKVLLTKISEYLNGCISGDDIISKSNDFKAPSNYKVSRKDTIRLFLGTFYGKRTYNQNPPDNLKPNDDSEPNILKVDQPKKLTLCAELVQKSQEKFDKAYPNLTSEQKLTEEMVSVIKNGNRITGSILCIVCGIEKREKRINIQYNAKADGLNYWNFSNLLKHLKKHQAELNERTEEPELPKDENEIYLDYEVLDENIDVKLEATESNQTFETHSVIVMEESELHSSDEIVAEKDRDSASGNDTAISSSNSSAGILNSLHDVDANSLESAICDQISSQNLVLTQLIYSSSEKKATMEFWLNDKSAKLDVIRAKRDGNCLFSSLVHQIFLRKMDSKDHKQATLELRKSVVKYIKENLEDFSFIICGRIQEEEERIFGHVQTKSNQITDAEFIEFLDNKLDRPGLFGGTETLKAVSIMHSVNIMIFNELGTPYFPLAFNQSFNRTVFIAYRLSTQAAKRKKKKCIKLSHVMLRDHYDSVAEVNLNVLLNAREFTKVVMEKQNMNSDVINVE